jgi:hypothetical protein
VGAFLIRLIFSRNQWSRKVTRFGTKNSRDSMNFGHSWLIFATPIKPVLGVDEMVAPPFVPSGNVPVNEKLIFMSSVRNTRVNG